MALIYYLTIDGIVGDFDSAGHRGAFIIADYSFDASAIVSAVTGAAAAPNRASRR